MVKFKPSRNIPTALAGTFLLEGVTAEIADDVAKMLVGKGLGEVLESTSKRKVKATSESTESKESEEPKSKSGD